MNYIVIEAQTSDIGETIVAPVYTTNSINDAYSRFHSICASAAVSTVKKHAVWVTDETGAWVTGQVFEH